MAPGSGEGLFTLSCMAEGRMQQIYRNSVCGGGGGGGKAKEAKLKALFRNPLSQ